MQEKNEYRQLITLKASPQKYKRSYPEGPSGDFTWLKLPLTHCSLETPKRVIDKQNAASDQGLHCLQIV